VTPDSKSVVATRAETFSTQEGALTSPLTLFTETDPTGGSVEQYEFFVNDSGGGIGNLILNGKAQANDKPLIVYASVISNVLSYQSIAGTEIISVRASDGTDAHPIWGAWASVTVNAPTAAGPQVVVPEANITLNRGQTYQLDAWFSVNDPTTGGVYSQIEFYVADRTGPGGAIGGTGGLSVDGVVAANDSPLIIASGSVDSVDYTAASGKEIIYVRANDGTSVVPHWGAWATVTVTGPAATLGAVFTPINATISATRDQTFKLPDMLFTERATTASAIYQYEFFVSDATGGVGDLLLYGNPMPNDTPLLVTPRDLALNANAVTYQSVAGVETVYVRADTGSANFPVWGAWAAVRVVNETPITETSICTPVHAALTATQDQVFSNLIPTLWTSSDTTPGAAISGYEFFDSDSAGGKGGFLVSGAATKNDTIVTINAGYVSDVTYTIHSGKQVIYVRANDGNWGAPIWSAWSAITVTVPTAIADVAATPVTRIPNLSAGARSSARRHCSVLPGSNHRPC
jgi:hypothetical protein